MLETKSPLPVPTRERLRGSLGGLAVGAGLAVLAAFLGELRGTPAVLLAVLLAGAVAGAFRPARRLLHGGAGGLALGLLLCLLTPVLRGPLSSLVVSQSPVRADAVVVLGAGVHCGTGSMNGASLTRLTRGLELWQAGYAPVLTISEQSGLIGPKDCPKLADLQKAEVAALYGTGGPELLTLANVTTTRDEAARVRDLARQRGWKRVLLVTSPWHSRRAQALFRSYGITAVSVPAQETGFDLTLPTPADRLAALRVVLYEGLSRVKAGVGGTPER